MSDTDHVIDTFTQLCACGEAHAYCSSCHDLLDDCELNSAEDIFDEITQRERLRILSVIERSAARESELAQDARENEEPLLALLNAARADALTSTLNLIRAECNS